MSDEQNCATGTFKPPTDTQLSVQMLSMWYSYTNYTFTQPKHFFKKKEINASKIYSPSGKFAERAKLYLKLNHSH